MTIQAQILALLDELQREMGMALLFITHDLNLVRRFTHRVGVMERGRLVEMRRHRPRCSATRSTPTRGSCSRAGRSASCSRWRPTRRRWCRRRTSGSSSAPPTGWFGKRNFVAVRDATLELKRGETLGIVGESGSGKTTLGMALLALQPIAAGRIEMDATRIDDADRTTLRAMRRRMQVVFQDPFASLSPRMTVGQIVGEGLALHMPELSRRASASSACWRCSPKSA